MLGYKSYIYIYMYVCMHIYVYTDVAVSFIDILDVAFGCPDATFPAGLGSGELAEQGRI